MHVYPATQGWGRDVIGWYYVGSVNGKYVNTCQTPCATIEEAKALAMQWYKEASR